MAEGTLDITISNQMVILNQPPTGSINALYNWWVATKTTLGILEAGSPINPETVSSSASGTSTLQYGQTFAISETSFITHVTMIDNFYNSRIGSPSFNIRCSLYNTSAGIPTTKISDSENIIAASVWSDEDHIFTFADIELSIGQYAFVFSYEDVITNDVSNRIVYGWGGISFTGDFKYKVGASWLTLSGDSMCFQIDYNVYASVPIALLPPIGWHVPATTEFDTLRIAVGIATSGGALKESGLTHWSAPNTGATNSSGFTALGNGWRYNLLGVLGSFMDINLRAEFWATLSGNGMSVVYDSDASYGTSSDNWLGKSIRLIKDNSIDPGQMTDYDGNVYNTVKIGDQVWMASNLQVTHFNNGIEIPNITDNAEWAAMTTEAMCYYGDATPPTPTPSPTGSPAAFRIYISEACSLTYEVFPLNFLSTTLVDELESGKLFYRRKFNGTLIFGSNSKVKDFEGNRHNRCDDWSLFWGFEQTDPCAKRYIQINKIVGGVVYPYWDGYFSTTDGKWDIDRQLFEITPIENDEYSLILKDAKLQHDILVNTPEVSVNANRLTINETYTHNHWLMDVMQYLIDPLGLYGTLVVSDFFTNATNYATGAANKLTKLTIAQKSDILRPADTNPARYPKGQLSWDELMEILKGMFQVYWVYDHLTDTVHVEHISWFTANDGLDLRTQALCYKTNKYSYAKEKMPMYESFKWMEADNAYFVGDPIRYDSGCVDQNPDSNTVETSVPVTTDIEFIYKNSLVTGQNIISDDGWVILQNSGTGPIYDVDMELAPGSTEVRLNMHLSWSSLHDKYFRHNRVMIEGYINNHFTTFLSAQKTKKQECTAIVCVNYDPDDNITTELGETYFSGAKASVERASIHPTGEINFSLLYGTNYITPVPEPPDRWILITMVPSNFTDHCTHFHVLLSEAAPVGGLNIEFRYVILPEAGPAVCANAAGDDIWNIAEGLTTDEYDITLDCAIPTGGCIYYFHPGPGDVPGWTIDFSYDETCRC